jgi:hypothetical protein
LHIAIVMKWAFAGKSARTLRLGEDRSQGALTKVKMAAGPPAPNEHDE